MAKTTRRLGRGLNSLVSDLRGDRNAPSEAVVHPPPEKGDPATANEPRRLPTASLRPNPFQPRKVMPEQEVLALAASIRENGILQPILVRPKGKGHEIIAGERRWQAAQRLGLEDVPVIVREADDQQMLEIALIENIQREDLNAIDRAQAYQLYRDQFGLSADQLANRLGEDRTTVTNYLRLLDLPGDVQDLVAAGQLSMGHARALLGLPDEKRQRKIAAEIVRKGMSVRALEQLVRTLKEGGQENSANALTRRPAHVRDLERQLEDAVKTKVTIKEGRRKGSGRIVIDYHSLDEFDRIAAMLGVDFE